MIGQATQDLPRVLLELAEDGSIHAVGMVGLVYGRQSNVMVQEVSA